MTLANILLLGSGTGAGAGAGSGAEDKPYLEFVSSTPMTITPKYTNSGVTLQYSLDGESWTKIGSNVKTPSANIIYFRGQATGTKRLFTSLNSSNAWKFTSATNLEVHGDITMLIQDNLGDNISDMRLYQNGFNNMFYNCTSLITAPELPTTTLGVQCYTSMFKGCTSLTTAPELPATTLANNCYESMFYGCTSLTTAPELPATTLANDCYFVMFNGCTSLTTLPTLPATTLANSCYKRMFYGCTKIKLSTTLTGIYDTAYRIPITGTGKTAYYTLDDMFTETGGTFQETPTINTTYYTENTLV